MNIEIVRTPHFEKAFRRLLRKNPSIAPKILEAIRRIATDPNDSKLKTHRLSGDLEGMFACSVAYDCRIVFSRQKDSKAERVMIWLENIGTHDEVY
jgi:mRNA interferase YafQ